MINNDHIKGFLAGSIISVLICITISNISRNRIINRGYLQRDGKVYSVEFEKDLEKENEEYLKIFSKEE